MHGPCQDDYIEILGIQYVNFCQIHKDIRQLFFRCLIKGTDDTILVFGR